MESQPQNPEFRIYPENFNPWGDSITDRQMDRGDNKIWDAF